MMILTNGRGWPSEFTRGYQIAEALGCKLNSSVKDYDETVIAVKTLFNPAVQKDLRNFTNLYMDFIDDINLIPLARNYSTTKIIVLTEAMRDFIAQHVKNELVLIPEHSCNFERFVRDPDKDVKTVGYVGSPQCFNLDFAEVKEALASAGLDFKYLLCEDEKVTRLDVVNFYKTIDIQITFRLPDEEVRPQIYRNPLKLFNAGSFGIPSVSFPEMAYMMCAGTVFLEATNLYSLVDKCYQLKEDKGLYAFYADRVYEWSRQFDIANIAKLYAALAPTETFDIESNLARMRGVA
jgi:hypothetical protein